jgi:hypothetical protein
MLLNCTVTPKRLGLCEQSNLHESSPIGSSRDCFWLATQARVELVDEQKAEITGTGVCRQQPLVMGLVMGDEREV